MLDSNLELVSFSILNFFSLFCFITLNTNLVTANFQTVDIYDSGNYNACQGILLYSDVILTLSTCNLNRHYKILLTGQSFRPNTNLDQVELVNPETWFDHPDLSSNSLIFQNDSNWNQISLRVTSG